MTVPHLDRFPVFQVLALVRSSFFHDPWSAILACSVFDFQSYHHR